jgi:O-antigen ligase
VSAAASWLGASITALWIACLAYPWVNPFAHGPSASVQPWLASASCAFILLAVRGWRRPAFPAPLWIAILLPAVGAMRQGFPLDTMALLAALAVIVAMAGIAAPEPDAGFIRAMAAAWLLAACLNAAFALMQYFGATDALAPWISKAALGEAYGNLRQRNQLASLLAIGLAALFWFVRGGWSVRMATGPLLLLAAGAAASASRTGALQWALLSVFVPLWPGARRRPLLALAATGVAAYVVFAVSLPMLLAHFSGATGASVFARFAAEDGCGSRRVLWSNVLHLIAQKPWAGWGWGELDYAHYMTLYPGERFCDILDNAHNLPLHLAVELGLPVAVVTCAGAAWALLRIAPWREADASRQLAIAVLGVIAVHSLLEYPLWYGPFQIALGLSLGRLWPGARRESSDLPRARLSAGVAALALCALAYAMWDYHRISQIYLAPEERDERYRDDLMVELHRSWLFRTQVSFAELTITPLTRANAQWTYDTAREMLHYSPEPRVIEKMIESASLLGLHDVALAHAARYRAAFPRDYRAWTQAHKS